MSDVKRRGEKALIRRTRGALAICLLASAAVLGLLATNLAVVQTCTPPPPNMVSWWPGEGNANDIIGSNAGTIVGGVSFTSGKVDQGFTLDGTNGELVITHTPA